MKMFEKKNKLTNNGGVCQLISQTDATGRENYKILVDVDCTDTLMEILHQVWLESINLCLQK